MNEDHHPRHRRARDRWLVLMWWKADSETAPRLVDVEVQNLSDPRILAYLRPAPQPESQVRSQATRRDTDHTTQAYGLEVEADVLDESDPPPPASSDVEAGGVRLRLEDNRWRIRE